MDGVDEPCSPTPPTGHQHQSGHLMCYEGRTSSRAIDRLIGGGNEALPLHTRCATQAAEWRRQAMGRQVNLAVFVFMISALVFVTQHGVNPKIEDFVDALYFTTATLSTTGFGDVTLLGSMSGELLSIAMMLVGITLFLRLAQAVFRPGGKVLYPCPQCGLQRHELDAVHCMACGHVLNIPNDPDR